jgi:cytidylate kinase
VEIILSDIEETDMNHKSSSERLADALEQARHHWRRNRVRAAPLEDTPDLLSAPGVTIALSREYGANGAQVARMVGERLHWPVYDRELLLRIAEEMGLHASLVESVDERNKSWIGKCLEAFSPPTVSGYTYARRLVEVVLSLGAHGACVIVGRGAPQILRAQTTLRVRLVAPLAARIAIIQERLAVSREEAARRVAMIDQERARFVHDVFRVDGAAPENYDLVLNSSRFTPEECVDLIVEALHRFEARTTTAATGPINLGAVPLGVR